MEVILDRKLVDKRVFPAIDIQRSGTRKEELLISQGRPAADVDPAESLEPAKPGRSHGASLRQARQDPQQPGVPPQHELALAERVHRHLSGGTESQRRAQPKAAPFVFWAHGAATIPHANPPCCHRLVRLRRLLSHAQATTTAADAVPRRYDARNTTLPSPATSNLSTAPSTSTGNCTGPTPPASAMKALTTRSRSSSSQFTTASRSRKTMRSSPRE